MGKNSCGTMTSVKCQHYFVILQSHWIDVNIISFKMMMLFLASFSRIITWTLYKKTRMHSNHLVLRQKRTQENQFWLPRCIEMYQKLVLNSFTAQQLYTWRKNWMVACSGREYKHVWKDNFKIDGGSCVVSSEATKTIYNQQRCIYICS